MPSNSIDFMSINCRDINPDKQETKQLFLKKSKNNEFAIFYPHEPALLPITDNKTGFLKFINIVPTNYTKIDSFNNTNIKSSNFIYINSSNIINFDSIKNINDNLSNNINVDSPNNIVAQPKELNIFYSLDLIKEILNKHITDPIIKSKLIEEHTIEHLRNYKFIKYESIKGEKGKEKISPIIKEQKRKRGRLKIGNKTFIVHNKMSPDNILKKIKSKMFNHYIINFINEFLDEHKKLKKLDYKYINTLIREKELKSLKETLGELFSLDVTKRYSRFQSDYNKKIIDEKIKEKKEGNETIKFVLNMTLMDFIDLFSYKKSIDDMIQMSDIISKIDYEKIERNMPGVEDLFVDLLRKNDITYATLVIFYLFNLERSLRLKQIRSKKL